jgi:hypothetical protein
MSVDAIRMRAARFTFRRRLSYLFGLALMAFEMVAFGHYALTATNLAVRIGVLVILIGLGWAIARFTLGWPARFPGSRASSGTILEFHRAELQRQRITFTNLMVTVGPMLIGLLILAGAGMFTGPHARLVNGAPMLGLLGVWLVMAWWLARRAERKRQRQIAEVDATRPE